MLAAGLVVAVVAAPGYSVSVDEQQVAHWTRARGSQAAAFAFLVDAAWTEGEARERGIVVDDAPPPAEPHGGLSRRDRVYEAKLELLSATIHEQITTPA